MEAHGDRGGPGGGAALVAAQHGLRGEAAGLDPGQLHRPLQLHEGVPQLAGCNRQGDSLVTTGYSSRPPQKDPSANTARLQTSLSENCVLVVNEGVLLTDKSFKSACWIWSPGKVISNPTGLLLDQDIETLYFLINIFQGKLAG